MVSVKLNNKSKVCTLLFTLIHCMYDISAAGWPMLKERRRSYEEIIHIIHEAAELIFSKWKLIYGLSTKRVC